MASLPRVPTGLSEVEDSLDDRERRGGLRVMVRVHDMTFVIPCGDGSQQIKWLANVAAQRYALARRSHGRSRQRESKLSTNGFFMPCNVRRKPPTVRQRHRNGYFGHFCSTALFRVMMQNHCCLPLECVFNNDCAAHQ